MVVYISSPIWRQICGFAADTIRRGEVKNLARDGKAPREALEGNAPPKSETADGLPGPSADLRSSPTPRSAKSAALQKHSTSSDSVSKHFVGDGKADLPHQEGDNEKLRIAS